MLKQFLIVLSSSFFLAAAITSCQKSETATEYGCKEKCNSTYDPALLDVEEGVGICLTGVEGYVYNATSGQCEHSWGGPFKTMAECDDCGCAAHIGQ